MSDRKYNSCNINTILNELSATHPTLYELWTTALSVDARHGAGLGAADMGPRGPGGDAGRTNANESC
jgi:hypothetical protein